MGRRVVNNAVHVFIRGFNDQTVIEIICNTLSRIRQNYGLETRWYFSFAKDKQGNKRGFGILWLSNQKVCNILLGLDQDGNPLVDYVSVDSDDITNWADSVEQIRIPPLDSLSHEGNVLPCAPCELQDDEIYSTNQIVFYDIPEELHVQKIIKAISKALINSNRGYPLAKISRGSLYITLEHPDDSLTIFWLFRSIEIEQDGRIYHLEPRRVKRC